MIAEKEKLLKEHDAADILSLSVKTLRAWRLRGGGPQYHKIGAAVRYAWPDLERFISDGARSNTSQR